MTVTRREAQEYLRMVAVRKARPRVRSARGRCYELSCRTLLHVDGPADWALVHGTVYEPALAHAWLERDTAVYDPVLDRIMPADYYRRVFRAKAHVRYSCEQAARNLLAAGHYGPWPELVLTALAQIEASRQ